MEKVVMFLVCCAMMFVSAVAMAEGTGGDGHVGHGAPAATAPAATSAGTAIEAAETAVKAADTAVKAAGEAVVAETPPPPSVVNIERVNTMAPITVNVPSPTVIMPVEPVEEKSWCARNPGWCAFTVFVGGAAVVGTGVLIADKADAFDREVSFK